jgi:hypothetical protein
MLLHEKRLNSLDEKSFEESFTEDTSTVLCSIFRQWSLEHHQGKATALMLRALFREGDIYFCICSGLLSQEPSMLRSTRSDLFASCRRSRAREVVRGLVEECSANVNRKDLEGHNVALYAQRHSFSRMVQFLQEKGAGIPVPLDTDVWVDDTMDGIF